MWCTFVDSKPPIVCDSPAVRQLPLASMLKPVSCSSKYKSKALTPAPTTTDGSARSNSTTDASARPPVNTMYTSLSSLAIVVLQDQPVPNPLTRRPLFLASSTTAKTSPTESHSSTVTGPHSNVLPKLTKNSLVVAPLATMAANTTATTLHAPRMVAPPRFFWTPTITTRSWEVASSRCVWSARDPRTSYIVLFFFSLGLLGCIIP